MRNNRFSLSLAIFCATARGFMNLSCYVLLMFLLAHSTFESTDPSKLPESFFAGWEGKFCGRQKGSIAFDGNVFRRKLLENLVIKWKSTNLTVVIPMVPQNTDGRRTVASSWTGNAIVVQGIWQGDIGRRCRGILPPQHPHHISPQVARSLYRRRRGWREVVVELINFIRHNFGFYQTMFYQKTRKKKLSTN